jgi:threonylcarbamoyladenosine tRNA methylthiotransferase MtaB
MKTFAIETLGCKVNQYETQQIRQFLEQQGLSLVTTDDRPELLIINTCCVTHTASAKSRQAIRRAQKLNPTAAFFVSGCLASIPNNSLLRSELADLGRGLHLTGHQDNLADALIQLITQQKAGRSHSPSPSEGPGLSAPQQSKKPASIKATNGPKIKDKNTPKAHPTLGPLRCFKGQTRAFLKIQDGCDGCCSYCIIPHVRPNIRSKPIKLVLEEAEALVQSGHKEIVLTGIFIGAYGQSTVRRKNWSQPQPNQLAQLLQKIATVPGLPRVRLSSLEPGDVTDKLLDAFAKWPNLMPHLHLPLQSGSERILALMRRQYTVAQFTKAVAKIKHSLDRPAITTDIIVGFPGETDADFAQSLAIAKDTGFAKMHVFRFSPRAGTAASKMQPVVPSKVIKERSTILRNLDKQLQARFRRQFVGEKITVLIERLNPLSGRSERYFEVEVDTAQPLKKGELACGILDENAHQIRATTEKQPSTLICS